MRKNQKGEFLSSRVRYIAIGAVRPNPQQPRRSFDETALRELADSIRAYGILQPLTVRDKGGYYELVAGERRLRAARMAGLREVPCLIAAVGEEDAALLALIENLQRRDLDFVEEAAALAEQEDRTHHQAVARFLEQTPRYRAGPFRICGYDPMNQFAVDGKLFCTHFLALQDPNTGSILSLPGQSLLILTPGSAELAEGVYHR